jgi:hypothetical protein
MRHPTLCSPAKTALSKSPLFLLPAVPFTLLLASLLLPGIAHAAQYEKTVEAFPGARQSTPVASLTLDTALDTLYQGQAGQIILLMTNNSDFPLCVKDVVAKGPDFVNLNPESLIGEASLSPCVDTVTGGPAIPAQPATTGIKGFKEVITPENIIIPPGQESTIAVQVSTTDSVQTGMQLLAFEVGFQWKTASMVQSGNLAITKSLNMQVLGESAILAALSIPSLLFLPGFLAVIVWRILMEFRNQSPDNYPFLQPQKPESWPFAVLISIALDALYFHFTNHSFFGQYGLADIAIIWCISIGLALLLYGLFNLAIWLVNWYNTWQKTRITPTTGDQVFDILYKLENQSLGVLCNYVTVQMDGLDLKHAFLIEKYDDNQTEFWLSPPIIVKWAENSDQQLQDSLNSQLKQGSASSVAQLLLEGQNQGFLHVEWGSLKQEGEQGAPFKATKSNFKGNPLAIKQYIVQQEF